MPIGYACLTIGLENTGISRCVLKNASEERIRELITKNLSALKVIINYNKKNNIRLFRISSDMIPFGSHPINQIKWWEDYAEEFHVIGQMIKNAGIRVSMHPGQYTILNSSDIKIVENAIRELSYQDRFLSTLGMNRQSKLVLHIGGGYGDKLRSAKVFADNYRKLPLAVKERLIIENDDKCYHIGDLLSISEETGAPVVFDSLHHEINPPKEKKEIYEWIQKCRKTWNLKDGKQKIHYSQQKEAASFGTHSDTIFIKPFLEFYQGLPDKDLDIMLEVKDKNLSAMKCINTAVLNLKAKELKEEWNRYHLFVMSRSPKLYDQVEELLQNKEDRIAKEFYLLLEQAYLAKINNASYEIAVNKIWSYIEEESTSQEDNRYHKLLYSAQNGKGSWESLNNYLYKCLKEKGFDTITESMFFYI